MDVTDAVKLHYSGTLANNGFILKFEDGIEFNTSASIRTKYYSANTNTIYPPALTFTWDDQNYVTGSLNDGARAQWRRRRVPQRGQGLHSGCRRLVLRQNSLIASISRDARPSRRASRPLRCYSHGIPDDGSVGIIIICVFVQWIAMIW